MNTEGVCITPCCGDSSWGGGGGGWLVVVDFNLTFSLALLRPEFLGACRSIQDMGAMSCNVM